MENEIDLDKLTAAELKELAIKEAAEEAQKAEADLAAAAKAEEDATAAKAAEEEAATKAAADSQEQPQKTDAERALEGDNEFVVKRVIDLEDGSGAQVFIGKGSTNVEALEDLNDKLYEAQVNASKKIRAQEKERAEYLDSKKQASDDENFLVGKRLKEKPVETISEIARKAVKEEQDRVAAALAESQRVQNEFVASHPDYVADEGNGKRMVAWVQTHGYPEFTEDNLEKAYQDLKASGLLKIKDPEASVTTQTTPKDAERIVPAKEETAQPRSSQRASSVPAKAPASVIKTEPTEDELYNLPMDKLRSMANDQLAKANQ